jgi:hypothetical protein
VSGASLRFRFRIVRVKVQSTDGSKRRHPYPFCKVLQYGNFSKEGPFAQVEARGEGTVMATAGTPGTPVIAVEFVDDADTSVTINPHPWLIANHHHRTSLCGCVKAFSMLG